MGEGGVRGPVWVAVVIGIFSMAACEDEAPPAGPRIAVIQDGSFPDARSVVSPGVLGLQTAVDEAGAEVLVLDTDGGDGVEAAQEAAVDTSVVATVIAPFTHMSETASAVLGEAGMPVLSLSSVSDRASGVTWRSVVAPAADEARTLAERASVLAPEGTVCTAGEGTAWSEALRAALLTELGDVPVREVGGSPAEAGSAGTGCAVAVWTGSAEGGAAFRSALDGAIPLLVASSARTAGYLEMLGPLDDEQLGVCPCEDVTTTPDPSRQGFVHTFQEATGLDPGPFAIEGYDAGRLLADLLDRATDRVGLAAGLAATTHYVGLGGSYRWTPGGDLRAPRVRMYEASGVRWLAEGTPPRA
jgi:ABC-type branched-subunit amino acid transport system substrate-binding protein